MKSKFEKETKTKSNYENQRKRLMRNFLRNYESDPREIREVSVTDGRLLEEIRWAGSLSKWISRQTDLVEVLEEVRESNRRR